MLELLGSFRLSREVYKTIQFVSSTCRLYHHELDELSKNQTEDNVKKENELKLEFDQYKTEHLRQLEGIEQLQDSFELAENAPELRKISGEIIEFMIQWKEAQELNGDMTATDYENNLFNEEFFKTLS
jgi:hypothetical protein